MIETPTIIINGSTGKSLTLKYLNHILTNKYNLTTLYLEIDDKGVVHKSIVFDNTQFKEIQIDKTSLELSDHVDQINCLVNEYKIDVILTKSSPLNLFFNVIVNGLSTIDYNFEHNLDINIIDNDNFLLRTQTPLVVCPQTKFIMSKILQMTNFNHIPVFVASFFHLKYIEFNTGIKCKYSYICVGLALILSQVFIRSFTDLKLKERVPFELQKYKRIEGYGSQIYFCPYPTSLPSFKTMTVDPYYCRIETFRSLSNVNILTDTAFTFKSLNLVLDTFIKEFDTQKHINILIYDPSIKQDVMKSILPLSTIDFEMIFILETQIEGLTFTSLKEIFNKPREVCNFEFGLWNESVYNSFNYIYNSEDMVIYRKNARVVLNEYSGLEELFDQHTPLKTVPNLKGLSIDKLDSILKWLYRTATNNKDVTYNVLHIPNKINFHPIV